MTVALEHEERTSGRQRVEFIERGLAHALGAARRVYTRNTRKIRKMRDVISPEFDAAFYRASYPDVAKEADALDHYITLGWRQERGPSPNFFMQLYLAANPDVRKACINPFYHYIARGRAEGRKASPSVRATDAPANRG